MATRLLIRNPDQNEAVFESVLSMLPTKSIQSEEYKYAAGEARLRIELAGRPKEEIERYVKTYRDFCDSIYTALKDMGVGSGDELNFIKKATSLFYSNNNMRYSNRFNLYDLVDSLNSRDGAFSGCDTSADVFFDVGTRLGIKGLEIVMVPFQHAFLRTENYCFETTNPNPEMAFFPVSKLPERYPIIYLSSSEIEVLLCTAYTVRGISKNEKGEYTSAIEDFDEAIRRNPRYGRAIYFRGLAKTNKGDYNGAVEDFKGYLKIESNSNSAYYQLGVTSFKAGKFKEAVSALTEATNIDKTYLAAYHWLGNSYFELGDFKSAIDAYEEGLSRVREHYPTEWYGQIKEKIALARKKVGADYVSKRRGLEMDKLDPYERGYEYQRHKKYAESENAFTEAIGLISGAETKYAEFSDYHWTAYGPFYNRGIARFHLGDYKGAIEDEETAIKKSKEMDGDDEYTSAYYVLGRSKFASGDINGAIDAYEKAKKGIENYAKSGFIFDDLEKQYQIALAARRNKVPPENRENKEASPKPELENREFDLGIERYNNSDYLAAIKHFKEAIQTMRQSAPESYLGEIASKSTTWQSKLYSAYFKLGHAEFMVGNYDFAIAAFSEALGIFGNSPDARYFRGRALYNQGYFKSAEDDYSAALSNPKSVGYADELHYNRAQARIKMGDFAGAKEDMEAYEKLSKSRK